VCFFVFGTLTATMNGSAPEIMCYDLATRGGKACVVWTQAEFEEKKDKYEKHVALIKQYETEAERVLEENGCGKSLTESMVAPD